MVKGGIIRPSTQKIVPIEQFPELKIAKQVQCFLGLTPKDDGAFQQIIKEGSQFGFGQEE